MKCAVVYSSHTGNTEMLAEEARKILEGQECLYYGIPDEKAKKAAEEAELVFAGFWTDKGNCEEQMAEFLESLNGKQVVLFGTAGFGQSQEYFDRILVNVKGHLNESNTVRAQWMCQGKMPMAVRKRYEAMQEKAPQDDKIKMMIDNFDRAASHPDEADLIRLRDMLGEFNAE